MIDGHVIAVVATLIEFELRLFKVLGQDRLVDMSDGLLVWHGNVQRAEQRNETRIELVIRTTWWWQTSYCLNIDNLLPR